MDNSEIHSWKYTITARNIKRIVKCCYTGRQYQFGFQNFIPVNLNLQMSNVVNQKINSGCWRTGCYHRDRSISKGPWIICIVWYHKQTILTHSARIGKFKTLDKWVAYELNENRKQQCSEDCMWWEMDQVRQPLTFGAMGGQRRTCKTSFKKSEIHQKKVIEYFWWVWWRCDSLGFHKLRPTFIATN